MVLSRFLWLSVGRGRERGEGRRMATVQCSKCTAERKGFRRELDSWRHKLIHCVGFESILEGIYGQMLLRDLNLFDDCEPEEVDDWSPAASCSQCSLCNLPLDKLSDRAPAAASPLSSPSDYSPSQAPTISESSQSAHRFLQAVFHKKDVLLGRDSNIPLVAQELMKKMIHQFALEYASKCLIHTSTNGVTTRTSSPMSETSDAPLDLTVSRDQEEKEGESESDGVLDLSNRNSACSVSSSTSSSIKASGSLLPSLEEDLGHPGQQKAKCHQSSALDAVLNSLCPSHCSLLYQILKVAYQEKLFLNHRPLVQTESHCCHCGINAQDNVTPNAVPFSECKADNAGLCYPLTDYDHQGCGSTVYHSGECTSNCSTHHFPLTNCRSEAPQGSNYCCLPRSNMETYSVLCPERLHYISCQSLAVGCSNNVVCSFVSPPKAPSLCNPSTRLCPSSLICCNQHNLHPCSCYSNHACQTQVNTIERVGGDGDPPCPILKREYSPSPPPLSPMPSDINKKTDDKPPSLLHHKQEEPDLIIKDGLVQVSHPAADGDTALEEEHECEAPSCCTEQNPSGTSLQDVVNRFSEKLETISTIEKDLPLISSSVYISGKDLPQSPTTSQNMQFHADAHLTEIITTVLHTGSASDYNLSELFNRHESKEPKSPNTRSRRRQEVLAAIATPANDVSTRRHTLKIKRELAMLDQSLSKRKMPLAKRARLKDENLTVITSNTQSEPEKETAVCVEPVERHRDRVGPQNKLNAESAGDMVKEELQTVVVTEKCPFIKAEEKEREIFHEEKCLTQSATQIPPTPELKSKYVKPDSNGDGVHKQEMTPTGRASQHSGVTCKEEGMSNSAQSGISACNSVESPTVHICDAEHTAGESKDFHSPFTENQECQSYHSKDARRSRRNIVPPQRFSNYVTEPRKMFFVACFSENIFNQKSPTDNALTCGVLGSETHKADTQDTPFESNSESLVLSSPEHASKFTFESTQREELGPLSYPESNSQVLKQNAAVKEKSPTKGSSNKGSDGSICDTKPFEPIRSSPRRLHKIKATSITPNMANKDTIKSVTNDESPPNPQFMYTSPIKLMFVSPVKDKDGVRYSLKSAGSGCSGQAEDPFDPCEESSWAGTPEKHKSQSIQSATPRVQCISSPLKPATSPARSACSKPSASSPPKSSSSPRKSPPVKSVSSTPKSASSPKKPSSPKKISSPAKSVSPASKSASLLRKSSSPVKSISSPKSASSLLKISPRRSGEGTPSGDVFSLHEVTPLKRRPGRPKKLGPQLEQKVKRPIGRPRKQKAVDSAMGENATNGKSDVKSDAKENVNKNLKITVVYGRSRRNKRTVSEGFDQLQTEFHDACHTEGLQSDLGILMHNSNTSSGSINTTSTNLSGELNFVNPLKESALQSCSSIKCQKPDGSVPSRKPGRPAKVKISGISITVTTVSPQLRKIQINKDTRLSTERLIHKKVLSPESKFAKKSWTISRQSSSKISLSEEGLESKDENEDKLTNQSVGVRHSMRVRKPSIHFLYAVATSNSKSYSHSNALLRRSKQLLLNKANNQRRQTEQLSSAETSREKLQLCGKERKNVTQDLSRVEGMCVDSIFTPRETLKWWAASAEEKTLNLELTRRIQRISDTWVTDNAEKREKDISFHSKSGFKGNQKSKESSVVRMLFDCPTNKPRSCSALQLRSWFMQTTETQSLAIVKKASSRNPYEVMHFPRSANKKSVCPSPQAERLRKHIKKFAKIVPKSPLQHCQAQRMLMKRNDAALSRSNIRRQLFTSGTATCKLDQGAQWGSETFVKYKCTLLRARSRFLNRKERERWQNSRRNKKNRNETKYCSNGLIEIGLKPKCKALLRSTYWSQDCLENSSATTSVDQTQEPVDVSKQQNLCSKAWSPETLKECRVFLRKINSPHNESTEEEWDSCTVTLDDGSPSAYALARRERELVEVVKAVKTKRKGRMKKTASRELASSASRSLQERYPMLKRGQKGKHKCPGMLSTEPSQPPPAKLLRQSRMRGLTGPRWCDFVFES